MTNIYLVRHAHSTYSSDERTRPLSEKGKKDAQLMTQVMKSESIDVVLSSPYKRAVQTVEGIAKYFQLHIETVEDFKERRLADFPLEDFHEAVLKVWQDETYAHNGGESNIVAKARGINALNDILVKYKNKNIVVGTHGNIMALIMNQFSKSFDYTFWSNLDMPDIYKLSFEEHSLIDIQRVRRESND